MRTVKNIIISAMLLMLFPAVSYPQSGMPPVSIGDAGITKDGNRVSVGFTAETGRFPRDYGVTLVPVLYDAAGNSAVLEPVTLAGRRGEISSRRDGTSPAWNTVRVKDGSQYRYASGVAWEPWMESVNLSVYRFGEGCGCSFEEAPVVAAAGVEIYRKPVFVPKTPPVIAPPPAAEPSVAVSADEFSRKNPFLLRRGVDSREDAIAMIGRETDGGSGRIYYRVGRSDLDASYMENAQTLALVGEALRVVDEDPTVGLCRIFIAGFASPEGSLALNTRLARERTEAVRDYLIRQLGIHDLSLFEMYNGGEDWNGLRRMVAESDQPWRDKVLYLIDGRTEGDELVKSKLKYFEGGVPYAYMLKNFFPVLRSSSYIWIYYDTIAASDEP